MRKHLSIYLSFTLAACGGDAFTTTAALVAGDGGKVVDAGELDAGRGMQWDTIIDAGAVDGASVDSAAEQPRPSTDAGAGDVLEPDAADASADEKDTSRDAAIAVVDGAPALACDPNYGDASPGGPCCEHVWATPTMGAVLCTVDGSRWCWQTGMPCSPLGSRCVVQGGVSYCAP